MSKTRRRGAELDEAIYAATRAIIEEEGLAELTIPKVAQKAQTSKPVIYRRFQTPFELAVAAIQAQIRKDNRGNTDEVKLSGASLQEDLFQLVDRFMISIETMGEVFLRGALAEFSKEQDATIQKMMDEGRQIDLTAINRVLKRAIARGERVKENLSDEVKLLAFDWIRYHVFMQKEITPAMRSLLVNEILLPVYLNENSPAN